MKSALDVMYFLREQHRMGSVRTQDTTRKVHRKWGIPLSKRAEHGEKIPPEVPFWREGGESSRPFFDRVLSSDKTLLHLWPIDAPTRTPNTLRIRRRVIEQADRGGTRIAGGLDKRI